MRTDRVEKRSRLACDPCRRKKIKCPNQRPSCSSCTRLGQPCTYSSTGRAARIDVAMEERVAQLEARLDEFTRPSSQISHSSVGHGPATGVSDSDVDQHTQVRPRQTRSKSSPSMISINAALKCYFERCHKQPVWLFDPEEVGDSGNLADEAALALLALTTLFNSAIPSDQYQNYLESARRLVMSQVANGSARLSTIESLCIICQACFQGS